MAKLIQYQGTIGLNEIFQHSIVCDSVEDNAQAAADAVLAFEAAWAAGDTSLWNIFSDAVQYTNATAAEILDLSTGTLDAHVSAPFSEPLPTGLGQAGAFQSAMAISIEGGTYANGTPVRGRFYLPVLATSQQDNGRWTATCIANAAAFAQNLFTQLSPLVGPPAVWSRGSTRGAGTPAQVNHLDRSRVGDVIDTIRSRRNGLDEVYTDIPVP